jgi:hypothetical protein
MPNHGHELLTVSPPRLERSAFARLDRGLAAPHAPYARDWLLGRFGEGLEIRLLRGDPEGLVLFQPGKLAWRPILGAERAVVVQDLRVATAPQRPAAALALWQAVEEFARYFGYHLLVALIGQGPGLIAPEHGPGQGWLICDDGPEGVRLVGRVLQGPVSLPRLPQDWEARAQAMGPGLVILTSGESVTLEARAEAMVAAIAGRGVSIRHLRFSDAADLRARAIRPGAAYAITCDGRYLGGPELTVEDLFRAAVGGLMGCQCPS